MATQQQFDGMTTTAKTFPQQLKDLITQRLIDK